jgi:hypothetical protein
MWLRADRVGGAIERNIWQDVTSQGNHGTLLNFRETIQLEDMNYNPAIMLSGLAQLKIDSILTTSDNLTIMLVYQVLDNLREENVWQIGDSTSIDRAGQTTQQIIDYYGASRFGESNKRHAVVSTQTQKIRNDSKQYNLTLGQFGRLPFNGKIAEVLLFSDISHDSITKTWESYLAVKYGITLCGRSYYNSVHDSIWNYFGNEKFSGQIIGIGKDKHFDLNQKQSTTTDKKIVLGANEKTETNQANQSEINDLQFIMLGVDTIAFKEKTEIYLDNGFILTQYGNFRVQKTGKQAIPTFLEIDYSEFDIETTHLKDLHLLINRDGEDFYTDNLEYYPSEIIDTANKVLIFKNIYWDTDNNGVDLFCISLQTPSSIIKSSTNADDIITSNNKPQKDINDYTATIYPNPSHDGHFEVMLQFSEDTNAIITIINQEGKTLQTRAISNQSIYNEQFVVKTKGEYKIHIQTTTSSPTILKIVII